jgi:hypothetical protein
MSVDNNIISPVSQGAVDINIKRLKFVENIQKWVALDNQHKYVNEKSKEIRSNKSKLQDDIYNYMNENKLLENKIKISDGELRICEKKEHTGLTFGYIEKCLGELITDKNQVEYVIKYLKDKRETGVTYEIKRTRMEHSLINK